MEEGPIARDRRPSLIAGDALLHPLAVGALGLLVLNDHLLKAAWPGFVTGKLSDLAGLAFFPILLMSGWELALRAAGRWHRPDARVLVLAILASTVGFVLVKTLPSTTATFGWTLGLAQWLLSMPIQTLAGQPAAAVRPAVVVADPADLIALPAIVLAIWVGRSRLRTARQVSEVASAA